MMYFHALTEGLNDLPEADAAVRARLQEENNDTAWHICIKTCKP